MKREYIDRETARRIISSPRNQMQMLMMLSTVISADVKPVIHITWDCVNGQDYKVYKCSNCGKYQSYKSNYCENCGGEYDENYKEELW